MARFASTGRAAVTYLLLAGLQRSVAFLILPFITHAMSPVEYGAASMMTAASMLVVAVIGSPLIQLIIRAAARGEEDGPALLRVAGTYCYILLPLTVALAAATVALVVPEILGVSGFIWGIELLAIGFQPAASTFGLWVSQARQDLPRFVKLAATSVLITAASKLILVVGYELGVFGWALSDLISAVASAVMAYTLVRLPKARVESTHVRYVLRFSLPLIPHTASLWALTSLSRPAMAAVSTLEQVGLLAFGLNLAAVAGLLLAEFNRAVLPRYSREHFPAPSNETRGPVHWQLIAAFAAPAMVGSGIAIAGPWLFASDYWGSFTLTGILLVGQTAYGLYLIPMNYLTQTAGLPKYSALASGTGAAIIFVSILVLGRKYGALGVAGATAVGYLAMAVVAMILVLSHKLDIDWSSWNSKWPHIIGAVSALISSVAALAAPVRSPLALTLSAAALLLVAVTLASAVRQRHP